MLRWAARESPLLARPLRDAKLRGQAVAEYTAPLAYYADVIDTHEVLIAS
jgi:hypothetical protein